jgi:hypothetical protein
MLYFSGIHHSSFMLNCSNFAPSIAGSEIPDPNNYTGHFFGFGFCPKKTKKLRRHVEKNFRDGL